MAGRFDEVMARKSEIMVRALGMDYREFERSPIAFDYDAMMAAHGYSLDDIVAIQRAAGVGNTPLLELKNLTDLVRSVSAPGYGGRIFVKDEAANMAGSFKDRRASVSIHVAREKGYAGVIAATSGNYGAAVSSQAARASLNCIIVQEAFDSRHVGQPEIVEKSRICEALGAEVVKLTVGPELFFHMLDLLDETGYFAASLYSSFGVSGIETLGLEIAEEMRALTGAPPDYCVITHAGGGNTTGTARGLKRAGATETQIVSASVDLSGLHMASDVDFNRKSFTTGHTGFGVPFATWPDRADVPRNAARSLRYMDRYLTVTQGEVFYVTEAMSKLEGLERGPSGNTAMAAAISLAREVPRDATIVVQETEYTGAGKHHWAQLNFAREQGVEVRSGDPADNAPGKVIVIPERFEQIHAKDFDIAKMRRSYVRNALKAAGEGYEPTADDIAFLAADTNSDADTVERTARRLGFGRVVSVMPATVHMIAFLDTFRKERGELSTVEYELPDRRLYRSRDRARTGTARRPHRGRVPQSPRRGARRTGTPGGPSRVRSARHPCIPPGILRIVHSPRRWTRSTLNGAQLGRSTDGPRGHVRPRAPVPHGADR